MATPDQGTEPGGGPTDWWAPPRRLNARGDPRHVGVELELAGLTAARTADVVRDMFGGVLEADSEFRINVRDTAIGDFLVELDLRHLHDVDAGHPLRRVLGELASTVVPMEVVCPPVTLADAPRLDGLRAELRRAGAVGTHVSAFYALGVQLNPELPSVDAGYIVAMLRAFVLLREWLRAEIAVDPSRRLLFFASAYPTRYCDLLMRPDYTPDLAGVIDDYLAHNPTRNRELDMLPLFAHLDEARVRAVLPHEKIRSRPTYHYRLPNALVDDADWTIATEWNRWVAVERLAERPDLIARYAALWRDWHDVLLPEDWTGHATAIRGAL